MFEDISGIMPIPGTTKNQPMLAPMVNYKNMNLQSRKEFCT